MRTAGQGPGGFGKREGFMRPGQDLVMAGYAGFAGTLMIGRQRMDTLRQHFAPGFLGSLEEKENFSPGQWLNCRLARGNSPVTAYEFAGEGGVLAALWNLSGIFNRGIEVDLRLVPIRQVTVEVCQLFDLNPYRLYSQNCILMAAEGGTWLARDLRAEGIPAQVVGRVTQGIARKVCLGEETKGFLERPRPDELLKLGISLPCKGEG